jgi:hypothetical protein
MDMTKQTESAVVPATKPKTRKSKALVLDDLFKQSNDKDSFDPSIEVFMSAVSTYKDMDKLKAYIVSELKRVIKLGKSPLKAIYQNQMNVDYCGSHLVMEALSAAGVSHVYLRLTDEAVESLSCPIREPHGALVNEEFRGKLLIAKVGNAGTDDKLSDNGEANRKYSGSGRRVLFTTRSAYKVELITEDAKRYPINKAMLILANWGYGCRQRRMIKQDVNKFQDTWLVIEDNIEDTYKEFLDEDASDKYLTGI